MKKSTGRVQCLGHACPPHGAGTDIFMTHAIDTTQVTGCKKKSHKLSGKHGACCHKVGTCQEGYHPDCEDRQDGAESEDNNVECWGTAAG